MIPSLRAAAFVAALALAPGAHGLTIDFDSLSPGATLGSQYAGLGVLFSANAFSGPGSSSSGEAWATNTDLTIVSLTSGVAGEDYGALGSPSLAANNIVRHYLNTLSEDGDPSFAITLTLPASSVSVVFAGVGQDGVAMAADTRLFAFFGSTQVDSASASLPGGETVGQVMLGVSAPIITRVVVAPGSYYDWVGVDQIEITLSPVPEPAAAALLAGGMAALGLRLRRRREGARP
jgi:hypothetical protein